MKRDWITLLSFTFLLILAVGQIFLPGGAVVLEVGVKYEPSLIDLTEPDPTWVIGIITFPPGYNSSDVDVQTVKLEGIVPADWTLSYAKAPKFRDYYAYFDGSSVVNIIWLKLYHMGVVGSGARKTIKVYLYIKGVLKSSATPFQGTGYISVKGYGSAPPPPPP